MRIAITLSHYHRMILHQSFSGLRARYLPLSFRNLAWQGVRHAWPVNGLQQPFPHGQYVALRYSRPAINCAQASGLIAVSA